MQYTPHAGILVNNDTELIVGGEDGKMSKFSLVTPTAPALISNIQLSDNVRIIVKMSRDMLLCG